MKKAFSVILSLMLMLVMVQPVFAYQIFGTSSNPYKLTSAPDGNGVYWNPALSAVELDGRTYNFKVAYSNAMSDWNGSVLSFTEGSANQGINMHHGDYGSNGFYGWTEVYKSNGTQVQSCMACAPTSSWDYAKVFMNEYYIGSHDFTNLEVKGLATHEIGHALGLAHSNVTQSVMHTEWKANKIYYDQSDDRDGISFLHGSSTSMSAPLVESSSTNDETVIIASVVPYETLDKLVRDAELVVEVKVVGNPNTLQYEYATFTTNTIEVQNVILGDDALKGSHINLIELGDINQGDIGIVQVGKKYFLFLKKYEGPVVSDAYVPVGAYQGKFDLSEKDELSFNIKHIHNELNTKYHQDLTRLTLEQAAIKIKSVDEQLK